jgi:hypothetical protein
MGGLSSSFDAPIDDGAKQDLDLLSLKDSVTASIHPST